MEYYYRGCNTQYPPEKGDHFIVEDLLDFSNDDDGNSGIAGADDGSFGTAVTAAHFTDLSISTSIRSCINPPFPVYQPHFCRSFADSTLFTDFCEPHDQLQELQWLSNFEEEPFSNEDLEKLHLISGIKSSSQASKPAAGKGAQSPLLRPENPVPSKARSKRSRAAPSSWSIRPVVIAPSPALSPVLDIELDIGKKAAKKKEPVESYRPRVAAQDGRKCVHCGTDKTPQWRMGPMGPKTLCNACGVRFKSGRLVPEYRPAASPTFVMAEHSNSHRKVLELRRQKEQHPFMHHGLVYDADDGGDILIHDHAGPDFRQLI